MKNYKKLQKIKEDNEEKIKKYDEVKSRDLDKRLDTFNEIDNFIEKYYRYENEKNKFEKYFNHYKRKLEEISIQASEEKILIPLKIMNNLAVNYKVDRIGSYKKIDILIDHLAKKVAIYSIVGKIKRTLLTYEKLKEQKIKEINKDENKKKKYIENEKNKEIIRENRIKMAIRNLEDK